PSSIPTARRYTTRSAKDGRRRATRRRPPSITRSRWRSSRATSTRRTCSRRSRESPRRQEVPSMTATRASLRFPARLVSAVLVAVAFHGRPIAAQDLFVANAKIVDPDTKTIREGNLLLKDGKIAGFPASRPKGFAGQTLDAGRRWVMPAL